MSRVELVRALVFVGVVVLVYAAALRCLVESVVRRMARARKGPEPPPPGLVRRLVFHGFGWSGERGPWFRRIRAVVYALALIGTGCITYGFLVEPYWLEVTRHEIRSAKLPAGAEGVRIVQISDLHCDPQPRIEDDVVEAIRAAKPDLIMFTGDAINHPDGLPLFRKTLTALAEIAPTYAVAGNWDVWYFRNLDRFGGTGAHLLDGETVELTVNGAPLWIGGLAYGTRGSLVAPPADRFSVFLHHTPDLAFAAAAQKIDLYLAGHTHGGQVALPWYGALITFSRLDKQFERGLRKAGDTFVYTNRGIGMEGGSAPRVRFCARPEVTVLDVLPAERP